MKTFKCGECGSARIMVAAEVMLDINNKRKPATSKPIWGYTSNAVCESCGHTAPLGQVGMKGQC